MTAVSGNLQASINCSTEAFPPSDSKAESNRCSCVLSSIMLLAFVNVSSIFVKG